MFYFDYKAKSLRFGQWEQMIYIDSGPNHFFIESCHQNFCCHIGEKTLKIL